MEIIMVFRDATPIGQLFGPVEGAPHDKVCKAIESHAEGMKDFTHYVYANTLNGRFNTIAPGKWFRFTMHGGIAPTFMASACEEILSSISSIEKKIDLILRNLQ